MCVITNRAERKVCVLFLLISHSHSVIIIINIGYSFFFQGTPHKFAICKKGAQSGIACIRGGNVS